MGICAKSAIAPDSLRHRFFNSLRLSSTRQTPYGSDFAEKSDFEALPLVAAQRVADYDREIGAAKAKSRNLGVSMDAELIVVSGKTNKRSIKLKKLPLVIGRGRHARLTIAHPMVSRRHSELFDRDGLLMVRDLGSLNGTVIDGHRVQEAPLPPNAEFMIGPLTFRVQYQYQGDLAALPAAILDSRPIKPVSVPAGPSDDTEFPDFEALVEAEILESEQTPANLGKSNRSRADQADQEAGKTDVIKSPAAVAAKKPSATSEKPRSEKPRSGKTIAAKASTTVEQRPERNETDKKPGKKQADDAFDDLLSELD